MSQHELERFMSDLGRDPELLGDFQRHSNDLAAVLRWAHAHGYQFSREEAQEMAHRGELPDDELDMVAGGWTNPPPSGTPTGG
jgi:predicted ribosomally synthesized peptide with nif11-like leader